jgi:hypothetical protein
MRATGDAASTVAPIPSGFPQARPTALQTKRARNPDVKPLIPAELRLPRRAAAQLSPIAATGSINGRLAGLPLSP